MSGMKFTDSNLKLFYGNMLNHYQDCVRRMSASEINEIYREMYLATQYALESPEGNLHHLERLEKNKVYQSFEAIFRALPIYTQLPVHEQHTFSPQRPKYNSRTVYVIHRYNNYNCYDSMLFNWYLLSSMTHQCHHIRVVNQSSSNGPVHSHPNGGPVHGHDGTTTNMSTGLLAGLVIIILAAFAAVLTFAALFYMLHQFLNSVERLWYSEGWLKAAIMLATSIGFGAASTVLTLNFATPLIISLALSAGINPVGLVIFATVCLTVIGAGIACLATSLIYDFIEKRVNTDSMDPSNPKIFRLTSDDEKRLIEIRHVDPIKVKCAMVALRAEITKLLDDEAVPSFLSRHFGNGRKIQHLLSQVRELRSGSLTVVTVGDLCFDCRMPVVTRFNQEQQKLKLTHFLAADTIDMTPLSSTNTASFYSDLETAQYH